MGLLFFPQGQGASVRVGGKKEGAKHSTIMNYERASKNQFRIYVFNYFFLILALYVTLIYKFVRSRTDSANEEYKM